MDILSQRMMFINQMVLKIFDNITEPLNIGHSVLNFFFYHCVLLTHNYKATTKTASGKMVGYVDVLILGHGEISICPIDSNGDSLIFDSLFCISEYM